MIVWILIGKLIVLNYGDENCFDIFDIGDRIIRDQKDNKNYFGDKVIKEVRKEDGLGLNWKNWLFPRIFCERFEFHPRYSRVEGRLGEISRLWHFERTIRVIRFYLCTAIKSWRRLPCWNKIKNLLYKIINLIVKSFTRQYIFIKFF